MTEPSRITTGKIEAHRSKCDLLEEGRCCGSGCDCDGAEYLARLDHVLSEAMEWTRAYCYAPGRKSAEAFPHWYELARAALGEAKR